MNLIPSRKKGQQMLFKYILSSFIILSPLAAEVSDHLQFAQEIIEGIESPDSFHIVDLSKLDERLLYWKRHLPSVVPYYAVKTNHDPMIVGTLAELGTGFDCASTGEIDQVLQLGVDPSRIIFAHPRKPNKAIAHSAEVAVDKMVFDSIEELDKMLKLAPNGKFLLRITTNDQYSSTPLSRKFGASLEEAYPILDDAFEKNANVVGIAFHVGSNCTYAPSYQKAIEDAALLFQYAKEKWGKELTLLDIGGGWPGINDEAFTKIAKVVEKTLKENIEPNVTVIAEPGRYFATQTTTAFVKIHGKSSKENQIHYYLSNGVFGMFIGSLYYRYDAKKLAKEGWEFKPLYNTRRKLIKSVLWGPTCDSGDRILEDLYLPEMETGEYLYSKNTGAYTYSVQTRFNQIPPSKPYYIPSRR